MGKQRLFPEKSADELLTEFVLTGSQMPFEEIVRRYAGMVYSVCYRVTSNSHDAEDATQAVFLSLALQAKTGKPIHYIGPWLGRVAHRLALDVKKSKTRRRNREEKLAGMNGNGQLHRVVADPADAPQDAELKRIMQEELNAMPAKYRMPLILHYFGGMNREEMAKELNCKPATLGVRVHRGRALLGKRLAKRGMMIGASLPFVLEQVLNANVPVGLVSRTASSVVAMAAHASSHASSAAFAASHAIMIARIAAKAVMYAKIRVAVALLLMTSLATTLAGPTVIQSMKEMRLHLQMPWDVRTLFRPLLRAIVPNRQVNAVPRETLVVADVVPIPAPETTLTVPMVEAMKPVVVASVHGEDPTTAQASGGGSSSVAVGAAEKKEQSTFANRDAIDRVQEWLAPVGLSRGERFPVGAHGGHAVGAVAVAEKSGPPNGANASSDLPIDVSTGRLTLGGGGGGAVARYEMPDNQVINTRGSVIGASGFGYFHQASGSHHVDGDLVLGRDKGSKGQYELSGGTLDAKGEVIGDNGEGILHQTGGTNTAANIAIGNGVTGVGTYVLEGDGVLVGGDLKVGVRGKGTLAQNGGTVVLNSYTFGPYESDYFPADSTTPATIDVARASTSTGTFALTKGNLLFSAGGARDATLRVGYSGDGTFQLGDSKTTAKITEGKLTKTNLIVRARDGASGTFRGWGNVLLTGVMVNNDKVIADGFNVPHTLDLSHFSAVENNIENPTEGGTHGWIARRKGALILPATHVRPGTGTYTWGESEIDPVLDLVNAVRFSAHDVTNPGEVGITLLSTDREDIPALPKGHRFIGVWSFDPTDIDAKGGFDFTIRYDDHLARSMGIDESILKFWAYEPDGLWHRIKDDTFHRDTDNNLIGAHADSLSYFAVSAPEPSAALLMMIGAGVMGLRRRRNLDIIA